MFDSFAPRQVLVSRVCVTALLAMVLVPAPAAAQINVVTNRYDPARTGANLSETALSPANVNAASFGKLYSLPVDGAVYAQPLYMTGVSINGVARNVVFIVTMNDKAYAFDADSTSTTPLWTRNFTSPPAVTPVPITDIVGANLNVVGNVGIQSTPVIDPASRTIYLVARTKQSGAYFQRLHALDIATGAERTGSPVTITAAVPGTTADSVAGPSGGETHFDPKVHVQRAGLALSNGVVIVAWASHEDVTPSHGWIMGFDATTLARVSATSVTPDSYNGGIWQGGRAPTVDAAGNVYFATGNGLFDGARNFGDSLLKFSVSRTTGLHLLDYFTPSNEAILNADDDDLSGSGFTLLPGTTSLVGGGKEGVLYVLNSAALGHQTANDTQVIQKIPVEGGHVMGGVVYWNSATLGPVVYNWSENDTLKAYKLVSGKLALPAFAEGAVFSPGHPGGSLTLSAQGTTANTGLVWASMPTDEDAMHGIKAGTLRAFNATTLDEVWNSDQNAARDRLGSLMKFVPPLVMKGKVYIPNQDGAVVVYGLLPTTPPPPANGAIGIDFVGSAPVSMTASEVAGVVPQPHWNAASGATRTTALALVDDRGAATTATVTWTSNGGWMTPIADAPGNSRMMKGYLDTSATSTTRVTVAGLQSRSYDVYVYVDGDNKTFARSGTYSISGTGITAKSVSALDAANVNFTGTFTAANGGAGNYVKFTIAGTGFSISATPLAPSSGTRRAPINAVQIVPAASTPPPSSTIIGVDFTGSAVAMTATETAGVVPQTHWNVAAGAASSAALHLADSTGAATTATITWSAASAWMTPIADAAGNARMMKGYLDTTTTSVTTVTVAGLPSATYDVYVYVDGDNRTFTRTASYALTAGTTATVAATDPASTNFGGTFTRASGSAGNYVVFSITGTGFTLKATPVSGSNATLRAPVNGIQIVKR